MHDDAVEITSQGAPSSEAEFPAEVCRAAELALEMKARGVVGMDLRGISTATDYFLVASGNSDVQVKAIANHIVDGMKTADQRPLHVEGMQGGSWVLIDYVDFVVHIFHPEARDFYQLEMLWGDAPTRHFEDDPA